MRILKSIKAQQSGQVLILSLIMLGLSGILAVPLLSMVNTGLKTTQGYVSNTLDIYAADTGIQKALWEIKNDPAIIYDRQHNNYGNTYTYPPITVDNNNVSVSTTYVWLLSGIVSITNGTYPHSTWMDMVVGGQASPSGDPSQPGTYTMTFAYDGSGNKKIAQIGAWLPHGFTYVAGSTSQSIFPDNIITSSDPTQTPVYGGTSLVWDVSPAFSFQQLNPPVATLKFHYLPGNSIPRGAASWVRSQSSDIGYQWDNTLWWYHITATATNISNNKTTIIKATVVDNSGTTPGSTLVTYEVNPP